MHDRPIRRILCPVDFGQTSTAALRYASALSSAWDAQLVVFHAYYFDPPPYFTQAQIERLVKDERQLRRSACFAPSTTRRRLRVRWAVLPPSPGRSPPP